MKGNGFAAKSISELRAIAKKAGIIIVGICVFAISFYSFKQDDKNFQIAKNLDIYYTLFRELKISFLWRC